MMSSLLQWFAGEKMFYCASWYLCVPSARSQKTSGVGRLLVTVIEAQELKACKPNGEAPPPFPLARRTDDGEMTVKSVCADCRRSSVPR